MIVVVTNDEKNRNIAPCQSTQQSMHSLISPDIRSTKEVKLHDQRGSLKTDLTKVLFLALQSCVHSINKQTCTTQLTTCNHVTRKL